MDRDRVLRTALWISVPFNLLAAGMLAAPDSSLGRLAALPSPVPLLYRAVLGYFVALFGAAYAWMALQPTIPRALVALSAIGEGGVFAIVLALWLTGEAALPTVLLTVGDLLLAIVFVNASDTPMSIGS